MARHISKLLTWPTTNTLEYSVLLSSVETIQVLPSCLLFLRSKTRLATYCMGVRKSAVACWSMFAMVYSSLVSFPVFCRHYARLLLSYACPDGSQTCFGVFSAVLVEPSSFYTCTGVSHSWFPVIFRHGARCDWCHTLSFSWVQELLLIDFWFVHFFVAVLLRVLLRVAFKECDTGHLVYADCIFGTFMHDSDTLRPRNYYSVRSLLVRSQIRVVFDG